MKWKNNKKLNMTLAIAISLGCLIGLPQSVLANDEYVDPAEQTSMSFDLEGITVEGRRPDWETKLSPGSVTVVHPDDFKGEQKTLSDLLLTVPGVHVREVNGKGQYTTVTVRGSTAAQVGIFIDGVLANLGGDSAVDLSTIPVQNVERIEVYRGYVPSRFGGTFIGGVVNIVTTKPMKTNVSLEIGAGSYGGKKGSMEITAPLGEGSLMLGLNYDASDGDFKYKNYAAERGIRKYEDAIRLNEERLASFIPDRINELVADGFLNEGQVDSKAFNDDLNVWKDFATSDGVDGLRATIENNGAINYWDKKGIETAKLYDIFSEHKVNGKTVNDYFIDRKGDVDYTAIEKAWADGTNIFADDNVRNEIIGKYANTEEASAQYSEEINKAVGNSNPTDLENNKKKAEQNLKGAKNPERTRKYNDYEKTNAIIKWQSEDFVVKGTYNKTDRHLPDGVWGGAAVDAIENSAIDLYDMYYWDSRRQEVESTGLMLQDRNTVGKLEWGWLVDYLHKDSNYRAEHINDSHINEWEKENTPFREWSEYKSDKYNTQIDGSYKLGEKSMLDFQVNYSHERMDVDGSNLGKIIGGESENFAYAQVRNRYDQEIFNFQVQNSITLDKKGSWVATPAVRYNQSKIIGYSDGKRFADSYFGWIKPEEEQLDSKVTWQMALKKEFNDKLSMRMTGGTYYRLLNMSEIAGDGAGILPAPSDLNGSGSVFPLPEEGKQFDISAVMNGDFLGAENRTTLTYFWRESDNMLQLVRYGKDYWCYFNDNRGTTNGVELQSAFRWNKFDLDLQVTYLDSNMERKNTAAQYDYAEIWPTHQPEWEGNIRLTYRPSEKFSIFTEAHYTDEYFTSHSKNGTGEEAYLSGRPVADLLTINSGLKWQPRHNWQLTFGCNDIFNEGPKLKIRSDSAYSEVGGYINPEFPIQGRTYYVTAKVDF